MNALNIFMRVVGSIYSVSPLGSRSLRKSADKFSERLRYIALFFGCGGNKIPSIKGSVLITYLRSIFALVFSNKSHSQSHWRRLSCIDLL